MTPGEFDAAFDSFEISAFRLEVLQQYAVGDEDERLHAFREGLPRPERSIRTNAWLRRIAATTMAGKSWSRVRLVRHPLSEYVQYELISYVESAAVGEEIRIIDLDSHPELDGVLGPDFWLFDAGLPGEFAILMDYDPEGSVRGYQRVAKAAMCRVQYKAALEHSITLAEYLARRGAR